jgi:ketosteroid isomerase-like protein
MEKFTPKSGSESMQDIGKYMAILEKQADGSWKYTHFIWNTDIPQPQ